MFSKNISSSSYENEKESRGDTNSIKSTSSLQKQISQLRALRRKSATLGVNDQKLPISSDSGIQKNIVSNSNQLNNEFKHADNNALMISNEEDINIDKNIETAGNNNVFVTKKHLRSSSFTVANSEINSSNFVSIPKVENRSRSHSISSFDEKNRNHHSENDDIIASKNPSEEDPFIVAEAEAAYPLPKSLASKLFDDFGQSNELNYHHVDNSTTLKHESSVKQSINNNDVNTTAMSSQISKKHNHSIHNPIKSVTAVEGNGDNGSKHVFIRPRQHINLGKETTRKHDLKTTNSMNNYSNNINSALQSPSSSPPPPPPSLSPPKLMTSSTPTLTSPNHNTSTSPEPTLAINMGMMLDKTSAIQYTRQLQTTFKLLLESHEEQAKLRTLLEYANSNSSSSTSSIVHSLESLINETVDEILFLKTGKGGARDNYKYIKSSVLSTSDIMKYLSIDRENRKNVQYLLVLRNSLEIEKEEKSQTERALEILKDQLTDSDTVISNLKSEVKDLKNMVMQLKQQQHQQSQHQYSNAYSGYPIRHSQSHTNSRSYHRNDDTDGNKYKQDNNSDAPPPSPPPYPPTDDDNELHRHNYDKERDSQIHEFEDDNFSGRSNRDRNRNRDRQGEDNASNTTNPSSMGTANTGDTAAHSSILLDIDLGNGIKDNVLIYANSEPTDLAVAFLEQHNLPSEYIDPLIAYISSTQKRLIEQLQTNPETKTDIHENKNKTTASVKSEFDNEHEISFTAENPFEADGHNKKNSTVEGKTPKNEGWKKNLLTSSPPTPSPPQHQQQSFSSEKKQNNYTPSNISNISNMYISPGTNYSPCNDSSNISLEDYISESNSDKSFFSEKNQNNLNLSFSPENKSSPKNTRNTNCGPNISDFQGLGFELESGSPPNHPTNRDQQHFSGTGGFPLRHEDFLDEKIAVSEFEKKENSEFSDNRKYIFVSENNNSPNSLKNSKNNSLDIGENVAKFEKAVEIFDRATEFVNNGDLMQAAPLYEYALILFESTGMSEDELKVIYDSVKVWIHKAKNLFDHQQKSPIRYENKYPTRKSK